MNNVLISIIINCYNGEKFLREAITSVVNQTIQDWEIIFWDNQSSDNSAKIIQSFKEKRIRYFYSQRHTTLGEARNLAIKKSTGKFIAFLDCDDWLETTKLEKTIKKLKDDKVGLVYTNGYIYYENKKRKKKFYQWRQKEGRQYEHFISHYNLMIPSVMIKREALIGLEKWFNPNFSMIEEFDLFVRIAEKWDVAYIHEPLCFWRAHEKSLTWTKREKFEIENIIFLENIEKNHKVTDHCINHFKAKIAYHQFYNQWKIYNIKNKKIIFPYLFVDVRIIFILLLSSFSLDIFKSILKTIGKEI